MLSVVFSLGFCPVTGAEDMYNRVIDLAQSGRTAYRRLQKALASQSAKESLPSTGMHLSHHSTSVRDTERKVDLAGEADKILSDEEPLEEGLSRVGEVDVDTERKDIHVGEKGDSEGQESDGMEDDISSWEDSLGEEPSEEESLSDASPRSGEREDGGEAEDEEDEDSAMQLVWEWWSLE